MASPWARKAMSSNASRSVRDPDESEVISEDPDAEDFHLRIVRTPTQTLHELDREEDRRKINKRRKTLKQAARSVFGTIKRKPASDGPKEKENARRGLNQFGEEEQSAKAEKFVTNNKPTAPGEARRRRNVYVNAQLPEYELDKHGMPKARYARNKVRTTKYTILTFLPKNLGEQFARVANLYFLLLVILQIFPIFGATTPQVAMLPLLAVLVITGVRDGVEDYRRRALDNEVNNSAVTRLTGWKNVNVADDPRTIWQKILMKPPRTKVSKGVRKLRAREGDFSTDFLGASYDAQASQSRLSVDNSNLSHASDQEHRDSDAADTYSINSKQDSLNPYPVGLRGRSYSINSSSSTMAPSYRTQAGASGVVDYSVQTSGTAKWERTLWKKLEVGDIILLRENEPVPADLVVLSTSDQHGTCFVETKNLDGETNLKPRRSLKATMAIQNEEDLEHSEFVVDSEPPHANLYAFNGILRYYEKSSKGRVEKVEGITINELLLRGCTIRNTSWVIGLCLFTGADSKIMLNQGETPSKRSKIEKETNFNVLANFVILAALCLICAIADGIYIDKTATSASFFELGNDGSSSVIVESIINFAAALVLFQNIVPIALVISVEMVKTVQAYFIYQDIDMYYEPLDHPCVPKTWNISDDLGQIEYIFSDKTGTLTQNVMEFKKCAINGLQYGEGVTEASKGAAMREGREASALEPAENDEHLQSLKSAMLQRMKRFYKNVFLQEASLTLIAPQLIEDLGDFNNPQRVHIIQFFRALALCHSVLADRSDTDHPNLVNYKAESPDEAALVAAARDVGFVFLHRNSLEVDIEVMGQKERWEPLRLLEFNSTRKRMSVIMRGPDGRILLICKGADTVIYQRLRADHDVHAKEQMLQDLEQFANGGLRTLCIASRYLSNDEYAEWVKSYDAACAAVADREDEIERACEKVEKDLTLLGATALEDKLQVGVPDTIAKLREAGIKIWIATGDKMQTAIEIGFSCNLLKPDQEVLIISAETAEGAQAQIDAGLSKVKRDLEAARMGDKHLEHAVVIDGQTLTLAMVDNLKKPFLSLSTQCESVICCRVSPAQKAQMVLLVKDGLGAMCLAIGDGANDVSMIQAAHIGVGIAGLEGAQASMSADYAIGQFRYLTKLLLVHGRWCYLRVAVFHEVFFYKNIIWTAVLFWYQIYCSFNGTYLFDYSFLMLFAIVFTCLPVLLLGAFDQDVDAITSLAYPSLYKRGIAGMEYSKAIFWIFILDGLYQSVVCFYIPYAVYGFSTTMSVTGHDSASLAEMGTCIALSAIIAANNYTGLMTKYWTKLYTIILVLSTLSSLLWVVIYSQFPYMLNAIEVMLFTTAPFFATVLLVQVVCLLPRYLYMYLQTSYWPKDIDIIREAVVFDKEKLAQKSPAYDREAHSATFHQQAPLPPPFPPPTQVDNHFHPTTPDLSISIDELPSPDQLVSPSRPLAATHIEQQDALGHAPPYQHQNAPSFRPGHV